MTGETAGNLVRTIVRAKSSRLNVGCSQGDEAVHGFHGSIFSFFQVSFIPGAVNRARQLERLVCGNNECLTAGNELDSGEGGLGYTFEPV